MINGMPMMYKNSMLNPIVLNTCGKQNFNTKICSEAYLCKYGLYVD